MTDVHGDLIGSLRAKIDAGLADVAASPRVALLDFPNHNNSGDSAIWLGELAFLRSHGVAVAYTCDTASYDPRDLARAHPQGPLLLHGGGNFGDLWPEHQSLRERVLADFPDRPVVQLPQTVHFREGRVPRDFGRRWSGRAGSFEVHCRDPYSRDLLLTHGLDARLTPDMAFALGRLERPRSVSHDVVVVRRQDHERTSAPVVIDPRLSVLETDWLQPPTIATWRRISVRGRRATRALATSATGNSAWGRLGRRLPLVASEPLAVARLNAALRKLSSGRVVVTDRLHGHILCLLLDTPHVLMDDAHGKVRRFRDTFTAIDPLSVMIDDGQTAAELVTRLLAMDAA